MHHVVDRSAMGIKYKRYLIVLVSATIVMATMSVDALTPQEQLGKSIFFDPNLSINKNQSCASCHVPEVGWTGPNSAINVRGSVYEGSISGRFGNRKPPSSAYAASSPVFHLERQGKEWLFVGGNFWDGRATGEKLGNPAADQAQGPFLNPVEQALPDSACVVHRVCDANGYPVGFENVWGAKSCAIAWPLDVDVTCSAEGGTVDLTEADRTKSDLAFDRIALSIAAFESSPESNAFTSKFDLRLKGKAKLTQEERRGFALFKGQGKCVRCHTVTAGGKKSLFTDFTFDNLGLPKNPENPVYDADSGFVDPGLGGFLAKRPDDAALVLANDGKHKVPTLRNLDKRPSAVLVKAYGHNGYFKSLKGIIHFYNTRDVKPVCPGPYTEAEALAANCWPSPEVAANVNTSELGDLRLTAEEEDAIVAFLKTLSDGYAPRTQ